MNSVPCADGVPEVEPAEGGCLFHVRVRPGGRCVAVRGVHAGAVKIEVTAPPENGKANRALLAFLAGVLHLPKSRVQIRTGAHAQTKRIFVPMEAACLRARLAPLLKGAP